VLYIGCIPSADSYSGIHYGNSQREDRPFIVFCTPEVSFDYLPNGGYGVGFNCVYLVAVKDIPLDKNYELSELYELYVKGDVVLAYGGLFERHRGHLMTEEVYKSYREVEWCAGGCGGCQDDWDYISPDCVYKIFPTYQAMKDYEIRVVEHIFKVDDVGLARF